MVLLILLFKKQCFTKHMRKGVEFGRDTGVLRFKETQKSTDEKDMRKKSPSPREEERV